MARIDTGRGARPGGFDEAWKDVLLTQHHDCWIVPYNGGPGNTWADQVRRWTVVANSISDLAIQNSIEALLGREPSGIRRMVRLFNPSGAPVDSVVAVPILKTELPSREVSVDGAGHRYATQVAVQGAGGQRALLVRAHLPPLGYASLELRDDARPDENPVSAIESNGAVVMDSDHYRIEFDPAHGGIIRSLVAKKMGNQEIVDAKSERRFNELRGHFYEQGGFHSSADQAATISVRENGPLRATVEVFGTIAGNPFIQRISISQGSAVIDCFVHIDWHGTPRIGEFEEKDGFRNRRRPAYDDRFKLLAMFPVNIAGQRIAKNAPYDVCESKLQDTFYKSWEDIKHNVILDWVDVSSDTGDAGLALFSDHTTSYAHRSDFPLGLTIQYAGKGLWGRDYHVDGPTELHYALMPHSGRWDAAQVSASAMSWLEPARGEFCRGGEVGVRTFIDPGDSGWQIPAMFEVDEAVFVRLFNSSGDEKAHELAIGFEAEKIELVELDGRVAAQLKPTQVENGKRVISLSIPRFGIRTLRFRNVKPSGK